MTPKVLVVLTSHNQLPGHGPTGWFLVSPARSLKEFVSELYPAFVAQTHTLDIELKLTDSSPNSLTPMKSSTTRSP